jgi:hypothetical protein
LLGFPKKFPGFRTVFSRKAVTQQFFTRTESNREVEERDKELQDAQGRLALESRAEDYLT